MEIEVEDAKLVTLAKASRARIGAAAGAAVRDQDGRTYTAASIDRKALTLPALDLAVAMAISSGASSLEAAAIACEPDLDFSLSSVRELAQTGASVLVSSPAGQVREVISL